MTFPAEFWGDPAPCGISDRYGWSCCGFPDDCRRKRSAREAMVARIANLAGVDPEGGILPPDTTGGIDRTPSPWWKS